MNRFYKIIVLFIVSIGCSSLSYSQTNQIHIRFIGNCGLHLTDGRSNLYIDFPYKSGAYGYMKYPPAEIDSIQENSFFLFTHRHADHYSKSILKQIKSKHRGNVFGNWNVKKLGQLSSGMNDCNIIAYKTKHRFALRHYSYLITWHGKRIFLSGDTETAQTIATVKNMDWAFVPYWIMLDAQEKNIKIDAKKFGLYHQYPDQKINNTTPERILLLDKQGEVITIPY